MINRKLICMLREPFDLSLFNKIENNTGINKPMGGLWVSPPSLSATNNDYDLRDYVCEWHRWCVGNLPSRLMDYNYLLTVELMDDTRVCVIDSLKDLVSLTTKYLAEATSSYRTSPLLDYKALAKDYDLIYLTDRGQNETRLSVINLYGYDLESGVFLNPVFKVAKQVEIVDPLLCKEDFLDCYGFDEDDFES